MSSLLHSLSPPLPFPAPIQAAANIPTVLGMRGPLVLAQDRTARVVVGMFPLPATSSHLLPLHTQFWGTRALHGSLPARVHAGVGIQTPPQMSHLWPHPTWALRWHILILGPKPCTPLQLSRNPSPSSAQLLPASLPPSLASTLTVGASMPPSPSLPVGSGSHAAQLPCACVCVHIHTPCLTVLLLLPPTPCRLEFCQSAKGNPLFPSFFFLK